MTTKILRRTLLISAGVCATGLFAGVAQFASRQIDARSYVQAIIYRNVPGIIFEGTNLDQLVEDITNITESMSAIQSYDWFKTMIGKTVDSDFVASIHNPTVQRMVAAYEIPIMTAFFMATDFFPEGYKEGRRISFVRSSDPYIAKCCNPLARFDELY
jgi:hypothetical protein